MNEPAVTSARRPPLVDRFRPVSLDRDWDAMRREAPVLRVPHAGGTAWLLTRYEGIRSVLASKDFSISPLADGTADDQPPNGSIFQDPPGHTRLRRLISPAFTARRAELLRDSIMANARRLIAGTIGLSAPFDLMRRIAYPLTMDAIAEIVGIPPEDRDTFLHLASDVLAPVDGVAPESVIARCQGLNDYIRALIGRRQRRHDTGADVIGLLLTAAAEHKIDESEMAQLVFGLPIAGYVSTTNALALAAHYLIEGGWAPRLRANPALAAPWVEELLRLQSGDNGESMPRYATRDLLLEGAKVAKGDMIVAPLVAANRDPAVFPEPEVLDPGRPADRHLAFGAGIHRCVGARLARVELQCAITALTEAPAELARAASDDELCWGSNLFGDVFPHEVRLRWTNATTLER